jgi:hypothetical protein
MPRFYFHLVDGDTARAPTAVDLPDLESARRRAAAHFDALIRDMGQPAAIAAS